MTSNSEGSASGIVEQTMILDGALALSERCLMGSRDETTARPSHRRPGGKGAAALHVSRLGRMIAIRLARCVPDEAIAESGETFHDDRELQGVERGSPAKQGAAQAKFVAGVSPVAGPPNGRRAFPGRQAFGVSAPTPMKQSKTPETNPVKRVVTAVGLRHWASPSFSVW